MRECSETEEMLSLEDAEISLKSLKIKLFPQKKKKYTSTMKRKITSRITPRHTFLLNKLWYNKNGECLCVACSNGLTNKIVKHGNH